PGGETAGWISTAARDLQPPAQRRSDRAQRVRDGTGQRDQGRGADRADARIYVRRRAARGGEAVECRRFGDGGTDEAFLSADAQRRPAGGGGSASGSA